MNSGFEPANLLEVALKSAADDPASRSQFYRELMESKVLIIPAGEPPKIVGGVVPQDSKISIANILFNGKPAVPFFSSEGRIPAGTKFLLLDAKALFQITRGANLILNPGLPYGKEFLPDEVARLLDGRIFQPQEQYVAPKAQQVLIGRPANYPQELVSALSRLYERFPEVKRAWVAFYVNPERDKDGGLLLAVDVASEADSAKISGETGVVVGSVAHGHKFVDVVRYDGTGLSNYFTKQKPFYQKSALKSLWGKLAG